MITLYSLAFILFSDYISIFYRYIVILGVHYKYVSLFYSNDGRKKPNAKISPIIRFSCKKITIHFSHYIFFSFITGMFL